MSTRKPPNKYIELEVEGRYALFTLPESRGGGEKQTYAIPSYSALVGLLESIYWKPSFRFVVDSVRVMNEIRMVTRGVRLPMLTRKGFGVDIYNYTYLWKPKYQVRAHIEWNYFRPDLADDRNFAKHMDIFNRALKHGGRMNPYLGISDCAADVRPCTYGEGESVFDGTGSIPFEVMFHSYIYPDKMDKPMDDYDGPVIRKNFWKPEMVNGEILFPRPEDCFIHDYAAYGSQKKPAQKKQKDEPKQKAKTSEPDDLVARKAS